MLRVILQPSFGHGMPRQRWKRTLEAGVQFSEGPYAAALGSDDLARLKAMHPAGWAASGGRPRRKTETMTLRSRPVMLCCLPAVTTSKPSGGLV